MIENLKKTLLAGIGAAVVTTEKVEAALGDLVKQGKLSSHEARAMAEKIAADGRRQFDALSGELGEKFKQVVAGATGETTQRLAALEARVAALEDAAKQK